MKFPFKKQKIYEFSQDHSVKTKNYEAPQKKIMEKQKNKNI